jgi:ActR/RegA family two-component response regulator
VAQTIAPTDTTDPAEGLAAVVQLRRLADRLEHEHVERAVRNGWSLSQVAEVLGVTRQAVQKKHARRLKALGLDLRRRSR